MNKEVGVVVIGGGTGIYPVVSALRELQAYCSCIINTSDSGGSTGRIRDEFGFPPIGDMRQALAALADPVSQADIRNVLLYRFDKGEGIKGHNLGNLIVTALQDIAGSTTQALAIASQVFRIHGRVIPISETPYDLHITYEDGSTILSEHQLDEPGSPHAKVQSLSLHPEPKLNPVVEQVIMSADYIIIGPGDFYASLQAVLQVKGLRSILSKSTAKTIYFCNIMTRATQTLDMTASQHVQSIEKSIGKSLDWILVNNAQLPPDILAHYALEDEHPVRLDIQDNRVKEYSFAITSQSQTKADTVARSLVRHDQNVILTALREVMRK